MNNQTFFSYKNHIKADDKSKIICKYKATNTEIHDSQVTEDLLEDKDKEEELYADSAYTGEKQEEVMSGKELITQIIKRGIKINRLQLSKKKATKLNPK